MSSSGGAAEVANARHGAKCPVRLGTGAAVALFALAFAMDDRFGELEAAVVDVREIS
jgi:hypothetical protein